MHQRTSLSSTSAPARHLAALISLSALASLVACDGEAYNLGEDAPASGAGEQGTCSVDPAAISLFIATQADVEKLRGCRELPSDVFINVPVNEAESFTLEPLAELEVVHGLLSIEGPLRSLEGLESLRQVASLELSYLPVADLTPLRGLTTIIREPDYVRLVGILRIDECDRLSDLAGLENVTIWSSLSLSGLDNLTTLDGLHVPPRAEMIDIGATPQLADASGLAALREVVGLRLHGTGLRSLDGFQLESAESISLSHNPALTDLDGLAELRAVDVLAIEDNDSLQRVVLSGLDDFDAISIVGNEVLQNVPTYLATTGEFVAPRGSGDAVPFPPVSRALFEVGDNPQLQTIVLPTAYNDVEQVVIYRNSSLTSVDTVNLRQSDILWIRENPLLSSVDAGGLERVADLSVVGNPLLSEATFANVQTFTRDFLGNAP